MRLVNSLNGEETRFENLDDNSLVLDESGVEVEDVERFQSEETTLYLFNRHQLRSSYKDSVELYSGPLDSINHYLSAAHFHYERSDFLYSTAINRHNSILVALLYIKNQLSLLENLRGELDASSSTLLVQHTQLLRHHQFHMHLVSSIPVNPKLVKNRSRHLGDYISNQKMEQIYAQSLESHTHHHQQHQSLDELWVDIDNELSDIETQLQGFGFEEFHNALTEAADSLERTGQLNMSEREHLDELDGYLKEDVITLTNLKNSQPHLEYLSRLSYLHLQLTDVSNKMQQFKQSLGTQSTFQHLTRLKAMPTAYVSLIAELARRNAFDAHYKEKVSDIAELLADESRKEEIRRLTLMDFSSVSVSNSNHSTSTAAATAILESQSEDYIKLAAIKPARFLPFDVSAFESTLNQPEVSLRGGTFSVRIALEELVEVVDVIKRAIDEFDGVEKDPNTHSVEMSSINNINASQSHHIDTSAFLPLFAVYESTVAYIRNLDLEWERRASGILLPQSTSRMRESNDIDQFRQDHEKEIAAMRAEHSAALQKQKEERECMLSDLASREEVTAMRNRLSELEMRNVELEGSVEASGRVIRARDETIAELKHHHEEMMTMRDQEVRHLRSEMDADHAVLSRHLEMANHEMARKGDDLTALRKQHTGVIEALNKLFTKGAEKETGGINNVLMNFSTQSTATNTLSHTLSPTSPQPPPHFITQAHLSHHIHNAHEDPQDLISKVTTYVRRWQKEAKVNRERAKEKLAFRNFARGDLALFLPTRNATAKPWAAFNISFPHYFLKPTSQQAETLRSREWTVARITNIDEKVVESTTDNPFGLGVGVKYFLLDVEIWQPKHRRSGGGKGGGVGGGGGIGGVGEAGGSGAGGEESQTQPQTHTRTHSIANPFTTDVGGSPSEPTTLKTRRAESAASAASASSAASSRTRSSISQQPPPNLLSQSPGVTTTLTRTLSEQQEQKTGGRVSAPTLSSDVSRDVRNGRSGSVGSTTTTTNNTTTSVTGAAQDLLRSSLKRQQHSPSM